MTLRRLMIVLIIGIFVFAVIASLGIFAESNDVQSNFYITSLNLSSRLVVPRNITPLFANRYLYPAQLSPSNPPTICIISLGGSYSTTDLSIYCAACGVPYVAPVTHRIGGVTNNANQRFGSTSSYFYTSSIENTLDIQIATTLCPAAKINVFFGPNSFTGFLQTIQAAITYLKSLPNTSAKIISISWGAPEMSFGPIRCAQYNEVFQAATGITICAASGDNAASDGTGYLAVDFPSSSPHVVSCGGTTWNGTTETAWSFNRAKNWGGGGGISSYFAKPSFQNGINYPSAIAGLALMNNRSVPDLSMSADPLHGWSIRFNGAYMTVGGTSAVAPAFAAMLGRINQNLATSTCLAKLYSAPTAFSDITAGSIDDLGLGLYSAGLHYDQATGLGTPIGTLIATNLVV